MVQDWDLIISEYQKIAEKLLEEAKAKGATQAEVHGLCNKGMKADVYHENVSTSYFQMQCITITVYFHHQKGQASTTDLRPEILHHVIEAACRIAKLAQPDEALGLPETDHLAFHYPDIDLYHPWKITPAEMIEKAKACEAYAIDVDNKVIHADKINIYTDEQMTLYANSQGLIGYYLETYHHMSCRIIARDQQREMQQNYIDTVSREPSHLSSIEVLAKESATQAKARLGTKRVKTCHVPVIFEARVADSLIDHLLQAISGGALYKKASFMLNQYDQLILPTFISIEECPYELKGIGSAPFDHEGVSPKTRYLVQEGVLKSYLLDSYAARRLKLKTTGNAGGYYNIKINTQLPDLSSLLVKMGTGLLVTEVMGSGVNIVTGDYSQGVAGFWVKNGKIQYPVEEITVAGNLREMYRNIVAISSDAHFGRQIQVGSILIERMTVGGE